MRHREVCQQFHWENSIGQGAERHQLTRSIERTNTHPRSSIQTVGHNHRFWIGPGQIQRLPVNYPKQKFKYRFWFSISNINTPLQLRLFRRGHPSPQMHWGIPFKTWRTQRGSSIGDPRLFGLCRRKRIGRCALRARTRRRPTYPRQRQLPSAVQPILHARPQGVIIRTIRKDHLHGRR